MHSQRYLLWCSCLAAFWVFGVAFTVPSHPPSLCPPSRYDSSLAMGLRSFLKNKLQRENSGDDTPIDDDDDDDEEEETDEAAVNPVIRTYIPDVNTEFDPDLLGEDLPSFYHEESVQDRISRVKSGKMTDDEKQAFLQTALSAKDSSVSRKPLRQPLPGEGHREDDGKPKKFTASASPFPKDTLLRNFARGHRNNTAEDDTKDLLESVRTIKDGRTLVSQKKKKEYLDMVTDPNRFHTYKSSAGLDLPPAGIGEGVPSRVEDNRPQEEIGKREKVATGAKDLGQRLEAAAIAEEKAAKGKLKEQRKREEEEAERKRAVEEQTRRRAAELAKEQLEQKARQREREEEAFRAAEERRKAEEVRLQKMQEKQEEYWRKQLQKERDIKMKGMAADEKTKLLQKEAELAAEAKKRAEEVSSETPIVDERESPGEVNPNFPKTDRTAGDILGRKSLADENSEHKVASRAFRDEQARKKAELDRQRNEQISRLKSLSSPLPSSSTRNVPPAPSPVPLSVPSPRKPAVSPPSVRETTKLQAPAPAPKQKAKKRIRQQLPIGDEEDDFDTFARNGPNQNMSIGDAMEKAGAELLGGDQEERSKKWGIDMSRINKSLEEEETRDGK